MGMIGNQPALGLFNSANIQDGTVDTADLKDAAVTAAKMASGAAASNLGYTPANKAGDTLTGTLIHDLSSGNEQQRWNVAGVIYGRVATASKNDSFNNGNRLFIGDGGVDTLLGTSNSSQTPTNSYVGLRHNGSVSLRAGSSMLGLDIDTSGRMTNPNIPAFSVYHGSTYNPGTSPIVWDTVRFNVGSCYSTSTGRFTAPVAGLYQFNVVNNTISTGGDMMIRFNGSNLAGVEYDPSNQGWLGLSIPIVIKMAANDYVDVVMTTSITQGVEGAPWNNFSGYLIG